LVSNPGVLSSLPLTSHREKEVITADTKACSPSLTRRVDVTGKIVLVLRHGPQQDDNWYYYCPNTVSPGCSVGSLWWFGYKAYNACLHGAKGMILVSEYNHGHGPEPGSGTLYDFHYAPDMGSVWSDRSIAETLVPDLEARQTLIVTTLTPASWPTVHEHGGHRRLLPERARLFSQIAANADEVLVEA
jgi:hypothetical protein